MSEKDAKRAKRCNSCYLVLREENTHIGFCKECAVKAFAKMKKRILLSGLIGLNIIGLMFLATQYAGANAYMNVESWDQRIYVYIIGEFYLPLHEQTYEAIVNPSILGLMIVGFMGFCLPFASYVKVNIFSPSETARNIKYFGDQKGNEAEFFGNSVLSFLFLFISGPFFLIHRLWKLWQLSDYLKTIDNEE